ncbi:MAG: Proteasome subunit beta, bacterial, partial [uncultured Acidimicrobiales bacterium]
DLPALPSGGRPGAQLRGAPAPDRFGSRRPRGIGRGRHPRDDRRGHPLRRGCGDGGRPTCHLGEPHQPPHDGEGVPRRPPLGGGDRRGGGPGDGHGQALPAPARALREGRGRRAEPRGQGEPAVGDGAQPPAGSDAGPRRGAALRRLRHPPPRREAVPVRRHRGPLRGVGLRHHRLGQPPRRHRHQDGLPGRPRSGRVARPRDLGPVQRRRRGLRDRWPRPGAGHLPDHGDHHRGGLHKGRRGRDRRALRRTRRSALDPGQHHRCRRRAEHRRSPDM